MANHDAPLLLITEPNSYRIAAYLAAAKSMDIRVLIVSQGQYSLISEVHDGLNIDLSDHSSALQSITLQAAITPFIGVLGIDDSTIELAAKVAQQLGFPHNPPSATRLTRRKDLARAHLKNSNCAIPAHWLLDLDLPLAPQIQAVSFPCVLKPLALSASRGVIRCDDESALLSTCARIEPMLSDTRDAFEKRHLLIESYIDGVEIAYEGFLQQGKLTTLVIFDKPEPLTGPYFEETIYVTPSELPAETQRQIEQQVSLACQAYGLITGPIHAELRINTSGAWILEVAARTIGGDCARSLDSGAEFNLETLVISLATGRAYEIVAPAEARGVMMIPTPQRGILRRVEGLSDAQTVRYIEKIEIYARPGNELIPLPEGNQYPGFIFARAQTAKEVINALHAAHDKLRFITVPVLNTRIGTTGSQS